MLKVTKGKRSRGQGQRLQQGEIAHALLVSISSFLKTLMASVHSSPQKACADRLPEKSCGDPAGLQECRGAYPHECSSQASDNPSPSLSALHRASAGARGLLEAGARRQGNAGSAHLVVNICRVSVGGKAVGRHTLCMCSCVRVSELHPSRDSTKKDGAHADGIIDWMMMTIQWAVEAAPGTATAKMTAGPQMLGCQDAHSVLQTRAPERTAANSPGSRAAATSQPGRGQCTRLLCRRLLSAAGTS